ncbi:MAG: hypothetical protein RL557_221 [archaeon]|jgi:asparagine N-glycosylation enzyme membrane subunit Stt3
MDEAKEETITLDFSERKRKLIHFFKEKQTWVLILLLVAVILGIYVRSLPMMDHTQGIISFSQFIFNPLESYQGTPGLWDITTNSWTLGPDLDPWLFLRSAETIVGIGSLPERDYMRNVPLGFDNSIEVPLLPYLIAWTYYLLQFFMDNPTIELAGVVFPVIMFVLTIISFFLFVREVFLDQERKTKANLIALIATFFMIVIPVFLSRTVAGIPEKESAAFFFMFLAFYFFLKGLKSEKMGYGCMFGILSGIATGLMGLVWGGVIYAFIPLGAAALIAFVLNKIKKKEFFVYSLWVVGSFFILGYFSYKRYDIVELFTSLSSGIAAISLFVMIVHFLIFETKLSQITIIKESKIPKPIISLLCSIIIGIIILSIIFGPGFLIEKIKAVHQTLFKPVLGRWNITVAENKQPNFLEWNSNFGPFFKDIPIFFWLFFIGSVVLFRSLLHNVEKKDAWTLTGLYILFLCGLIFSRYSDSSIFNGENFISKTFYYASLLIFVIAVIYYYMRYHRAHNSAFENIPFEYILLFCLFVFTLFTVRGAVRLIMILGPIAPIFVSYLIVISLNNFFVSSGARKIMIGIAAFIIVIASAYSFMAFYESTQVQSFSFIPSSYNLQWQKAMDWVRTSTPENAVFAHWWDYGYWLQSIGKRATVVDGGNAITYWNYLMGRHVLTGNTEADALEFLYNHNATHLLIDSSDIGKYSAFSSIGSDEHYDRYSWIGTFLLDDKQIQETSNLTHYFYLGGVPLDEDLMIEENGNEIFIPAQQAGVGAIVLSMHKDGKTFDQPYIIIVNQNKQHKVPLRYASINGQFFDFKSGIEAAAFIFPRLNIQGQSVSKNDIGAAMFISPRLFRGMLSQIYILNDPLKKYPHFTIAHSQDSLLIEDLRRQGMQLGDFVYYNGIHGPIKIWDISYTGNEQMRQEYLDTDETKYLSWVL